ncbi:hypothetical protein Cgig2_024202 [Carnegiea gigantea]|uniref:Uncharacterized protein n=1 Tax=Carnegiea gigantea TaxID=171969 RepID=A0A9Q1KI90_9CARY|nr:hypothetical protein Cgig2_024202 [Carnegiea gigantea]
MEYPSRITRKDKGGDPLSMSMCGIVQRSTKSLLRGNEAMKVNPTRISPWVADTEKDINVNRHGDLHSSYSFDPAPPGLVPSNSRGELSISAAMMTSSSEVPKRADAVVVDTKERLGDGHEMDGGGEGKMDFSVGNESRSPPQSLQTTQTGKHKSKGDCDGSDKRHNQNIDNCLGVLNKVMSYEVQSFTPLTPPPPPPLENYDQVKMGGSLPISYYEDYFGKLS